MVQRKVDWLGWRQSSTGVCELYLILEQASWSIVVEKGSQKRNSRRIWLAWRIEVNWRSAGLDVQVTVHHPCLIVPKWLYCYRRARYDDFLFVPIMHVGENSLVSFVLSKALRFECPGVRIHLDPPVQ